MSEGGRRHHEQSCRVLLLTIESFTVEPLEVGASMVVVVGGAVDSTSGVIPSEAIVVVDDTNTD